jgi:hypothetical protein
MLAVHCLLADCSDFSTAVVNATQYAGLIVNLARGSDGLPLLAYYDGNGSGLVTTHCDDHFCQP